MRNYIFSQIKNPEKMNNFLTLISQYNYNDVFNILNIPMKSQGQIQPQNFNDINTTSSNINNFNF